MIRINGYPIDLAIVEDHSLDSEVTEYPVESGADISDNIRNKPLEITLEGIVSDTPIGAIAQDPTRRPEAGAPSPSMDAYSRILAIREEREPVTIETSLGKFENMALTHIGIPRDRTTGKALKFTVSFRQIRVVKNARTTRVAVPHASGKVNGGNRQPLLGVNGKPMPEAGESVTRWVKSYGSQFRKTLRQSLGAPILTTTRAQRLATGGRKDPFTMDSMDHYPLTGEQSIADGYVQRGRDHKDAFYAMSVGVDKYGRTYGTGGSTTTTWQKIGDKEVEYDYADRAWKDKDGNVVRKVPPGERWKGVTWGKVPK